MEPFVNRIRYEEPSYIEEYAAELAHVRHSPYKQILDMEIIVSRYFFLKRYGNLRKKSLQPLPPRAHYNRIALDDEDLEWKLKFGPYHLRGDLPLRPVLEDIGKKLSDLRFGMKDGSLEMLLSPIFCSLREQYPEILKGWDCPENYDPPESYNPPG